LFNDSRELPKPEGPDPRNPANNQGNNQGGNRTSKATGSTNQTTVQLWEEWKMNTFDEVSFALWVQWVLNNFNREWVFNDRMVNYYFALPHFGTPND